jgi:hypothetical protein
VTATRRCRFPTPYHPMWALLILQPRYKDDGPGGLYVVTRIDDESLDDYDTGAITLDELLDDLEVKLGHSKCIPRRQRQYVVCDNGQTHVWHCYYEAPRRKLAGAFFRSLLALTQHCRAHYSSGAVAFGRTTRCLRMSWLRCSPPRVLGFPLCW